VNILNPNFKYVPANKTDIRKTFERAREALVAKQQKPPASPPASK